MELPKRKSIRLKDYDYSQDGAYFITICTHNKECILGEIVGNGLDHSENVNPICSMKLNCYGEIVENELKNISEHFSYITIDKYVIMPNHIHAIILIDNDYKTERSRPFPTLSTVIGLYKSGVSRKSETQIWQKSFHDHIIRNEKEYLEIWEYIDINPLKWADDCYHTK